MARTISPIPMVASLVLLSACARPAAVPAEVKPTGTVCAACVFPADAFRLSQKLTLTVGRRSYCFNGYLAVRKPGLLRASGFGEMGGRLFDLLVRPEGAQILFKPGRMPTKPMLEGVVEDLRFLFLEGEAVGYAGPDGHLALARQLRGGRVEREVHFSEYRPLFDGATWSGPGRVLVQNFRWHYRLEIETLSLNLAPPGDRVFEAQE